ncbi:MAG: FG-GAP repeat domain-containing protein, partial [bacterium]
MAETLAPRNALALGLTLIVAWGCGSPKGIQPPRFVEETAQSGISQIYDGDWEFYVGGGVAVFDCNADGRPDLFLAGGQNAAALYRNDSLTGGPLRFSRQSEGPVLTQVTGAYPLDVDGDGRVDLAVLRVGENVLLRGRGDCRFERANERWGFAGGDAWSTAFSAHWEKGNDWPTAAVGNYVDRSKPGGPFGACHNNYLYRPAAGRGGFAAPVALSPGYCTLSILFSDWDRSGTADLRVTNDRHYYRGGEEQLWRIRPGAVPALYGRADGWGKLEIWG